jgi:pyruvate/2-oxoglutarate dehydrogenase complex dihydrolipoamide acyltransferase (E2) component
MPDFASSKARDLAAEMGIDPDSIEGTGRGGRVTVADVRAAVPADGPAEFGPAGQELWRQVISHGEEGLILRPDEAAVLATACRTADQITTLEATLARSPAMMIPGSKGQEILHPAIAELRLQRQLLAQLLGRLDVPEHLGDEDGEWDNLTASQRARKAARERWS